MKFDAQMTGGHPVEILAKISGQDENGVYLCRWLMTDGTKKLVTVKKAKVLEQLTGSVRPFTTYLHHLNIAPIYNHVQIQDEEFWVSKWIDGVSVGQILEKTISEGRILPLSLTLNIVSQLANALAYLQTFTEPKSHSPAKIAHGDINPFNVMVQSDAGVKLIDFGLARVRLESAKQNVTARGAHPAYASPQRLIDKRIDPQDDIFSLGIIFWELLVGQYYWGDLNAMQIRTELENFTPKDPRAYRANLPADVCRLVLHCLETEAFQGYKDPQELLNDLQPILKQHSFAADEEWLRREFGQSMDKYLGALKWPAKKPGEILAPVPATSAAKGRNQKAKPYKFNLDKLFLRAALRSTMRISGVLAAIGVVIALCLRYPVYFPAKAFGQSPAKDVWAYTFQPPLKAEAKQDHIVRIDVENGPAMILVDGVKLKQKTPLYVSLNRERYSLLEVRPPEGMPYELILPPGTTAATVNYKYRRHLLR